MDNTTKDIIKVLSVALVFGIFGYSASTQLKICNLEDFVIAVTGLSALIGICLGIMNTLMRYP